MAEASTRAANALRELHLNAEFEPLGKDRVSAWRCLLRDSHGEHAPDGEGLGKGRSPEESRIGSLCEALEHFLSGRYFGDAIDITVCRQAEVGAGKLENEAFTRLLTDPDSLIGCLPFWGLTGETEPLMVPAGVVCPWYVEDSSADLRKDIGDATSYQNLWRYSSNSGVALGIGRDEAILHALHEVIERDSYSLFLLDACVRGRDVGSLRLRRELLNDSTSELLAAAERLVDADIAVFDLISDIGVPAAFAMARRDDALIPYRGSGSSLSQEHAIARAITELIQDCEYERWAEDTRRLSDSKKPSFPSAIERCRTLQLPLREAPTRIPRQTAPAQPVRAQLAATLDHLVEAGFEAFVRTIRQFPNDVCVVQVFVPELERFMLVTAGHPLAPGRRGQHHGLMP